MGFINEKVRFCFIKVEFEISVKIKEKVVVCGKLPIN